MAFDSRFLRSDLDDNTVKSAHGAGAGQAAKGIAFIKEIPNPLRVVDIYLCRLAASARDILVAALQEKPVS